MHVSTRECDAHERHDGEESSAPISSSVTVSVVGNSQVLAEPSALTFGSSDWDTPQTVTLTAVDDLVDERSELHTVWHAVTSDDVAYNGAGVRKTVVVIREEPTHQLHFTGPVKSRLANDLLVMIVIRGGLASRAYVYL